MLLSWWGRICPYAFRLQKCQRLLLAALVGNTPGRPNLRSGEKDFCFIARLETRPEMYLRFQLCEQRGFFTLEEGLLHLRVGIGSIIEVNEPYVGCLYSS